MKKTIITAAAAVILAGTVNVMTASADDIQKVEKHDGTTYTYDECVSIIFNKAWGDTYDDGVTFPQESFLYHRIRDFLDRYYLTPNDYRGSWDRYGDIAHKWKLYNTDYWSEISSNDDDNGNYTIVDKDDNLLYTFELADGKWQQLDTSGNVVDTFDPHPVGKKTLEVDEDDEVEDTECDDEEKVYYYNIDDSETAVVTGMVNDELVKPAKPKDDSKRGGSRVHSDISGSDDSSAGAAGASAFAQTNESEEKESANSSKTKYIAIGAAALLAGVAAAISLKKNRK